MSRRFGRLLVLVAAVLAPTATGASTANNTPVWHRLGPDVAAVVKVVTAGDGETVWVVTSEVAPVSPSESVWPQVFRSSDRGRTWIPAGGHPGAAGLPVGIVWDLANDPRDPQVAWVNVETAQYDIEVYRTGDGGATWARMEAGSAEGGVGNGIHSLAIDADGRVFGYYVNDRLYRWDEDLGRFLELFDGAFVHIVAVAGDALWIVTEDPPSLVRSNDGGETWQVVNDDPTLLSSTTWLVADPRVGERLWVGKPEGLLRSDDGGATFAAVGDGLESAGPVTLDPNATDVLYAAAYLRSSGDDLENQFLRSLDAGETWQPWPSDDPLAHAGFGVHVALDPQDPERALIASARPGTLGLFATDDDGSTLEEANLGIRGRATAVEVDAAQPDRLWALAGDTLFGRAGAAEPWRRAALDPLRSDPARGYAIHAIAVDGETSGKLWVSTSYDRLWRSADGGETWTLVDAELPEGVNWPGGLAGDPGSSDTLYSIAACRPRCEAYELTRSDDGGLSWSGPGLDLDGIRQIIPHPKRAARRVLVGSRCALYVHGGCVGFADLVAESANGGRTWKEIKNLSAKDPLAAAYSPVAPNTLLVATTQGLFQRKDNGGLRRLDRRHYLALAGGKHHLYALVRGTGGVVRVFRSANGRHWQAVEAGLDAAPSVLRVVPGNPDRVYAATSTGVYELVP